MNTHLFRPSIVNYNNTGELKSQVVTHLHTEQYQGWKLKGSMYCWIMKQTWPIHIHSSNHILFFHCFNMSYLQKQLIMS